MNRAQRAGGGSLVIYTNNVSPARGRALRWVRQDTAKELLPNERVAWCSRKRSPGRFGVDLVYSEDHGAGYMGLMRCGSVWTCPICSAKITKHRREELGRAVVGWGGSVMLLTLTLQHNQGDRCKRLTNDLKDAWRRLQQGKTWQRLKADYGIVAYVCSTEVTHGGNGWHPHLHILLFSSLAASELDHLRLEERLKGRWVSMLAKNGRYASHYYGLTLRMGNDKAGDYAAKFGIEYEVVGGQQTKEARRDGYTPFQLLDLAGAGDAKAGELFKEYAEAFKGYKQLTWSKGARELLGLAEADKTDEALAGELEADDGVQVLLTLTPQQWGIVCRHGRRGDLLEVADNAKGDVLPIWEYLIGLGITPLPENVGRAGSMI